MRCLRRRNTAAALLAIAGTAMLAVGTSDASASAATSGAPTLGRPQLLAPAVNDVALSADGHAVAWDVIVDLHDQSVVRWKDLRTGRIQLASADASGTALTGDSAYPGISPDGRYVAFLEMNYSPVVQKLLVKDTMTGALTTVTTARSGHFLPDVAPALTKGAHDLVYLDHDQRLVRHELVTGRSSEIASHVWTFALSADGQHVVYAVAASSKDAPQTVVEQDLATGQRRALTVPGETLDPPLAPDSLLQLGISADGLWVTYCGRVTSPRTGSQRMNAVHLFAASGRLAYDSISGNPKTATAVGCSVGDGGLLQYVSYDQPGGSRSNQVVLRALSGATLSARWLQVGDLSPDGQALLGTGWDIKAFMIPVHSN